MKGEKIKAESSKQLQRKVNRVCYRYLRITAVFIEDSPECCSGMYVGRTFSTLRKRVWVVSKEKRQASSTFFRSYLISSLLYVSRILSDALSFGFVLVLSY